jgi:hypothetical protein
MTYDCQVCTGVNHASRLHCEYCGTIPAQYSPLGRQATDNHELTSKPLVEVYVAFGAERLESRRAIHHYARTVKYDYYAESND